MAVYYVCLVRKLCSLTPLYRPESFSCLLVDSQAVLQSFQSVTPGSGEEASYERPTPFAGTQCFHSQLMRPRVIWSDAGECGRAEAIFSSACQGPVVPDQEVGTQMQI